MLNSVIYHQVLEVLKSSPQVSQLLGSQYWVMNCNGRIWPLLQSTNVNFDLTVFGLGDNKAKVSV